MYDNNFCLFSPGKPNKSPYQTPGYPTQGYPTAGYPTQQYQQGPPGYSSSFARK